MVQIKLFFAFILAAAAIVPGVALPMAANSDFLTVPPKTFGKQLG